MMNILFVCSANISRSFFAEMLLKNEMEKLKLDNISVTSAGIHASPGNPPDLKMVDYLTKMGVSAEEHESRQITEQDVDWADFIFVMEKDHKTTIESMWPQSKGKVELLGKFMSGGPVADDIVDPYHRSPYHYRLAQSQITLSIQSLVKQVILDQNA
jgi:protein-tyrosine-phosphatase